MPPLGWAEIALIALASVCAVIGVAVVLSILYEVGEWVWRRVRP
jgi:hypothetical protein